MIYGSVCGSRAYGLNTRISDTDVIIVTNNPSKGQYLKDAGNDVYPLTYDKFLAFHPGDCKDWGNCAQLFPHEFIIVNDLSKWIAENREQMIMAMLPSVYEAYNAICAHFVRNTRRDNKCIMYAIHFRNMLANYAEGMTFAEAIKPQGSDRTFLLSVRNGIAPKELVVEENRKARERAIAVAGFYAEPKADLSTLREFKQMVYREVQLLKDKGGNES